ncbi:uncharacterized protein (DUF2236 family) [Herbihabitans rhizosphaerae]|uniref:Uncharacterized protein (DUF2236 family) n=1 Tax=Herbihabitans rhizosphaerae TaxID=1872711 RepID=A0A4Q7KDC1_9PSEU|nr:oxygenase MpaB family protein [Herbihabitans rhizosphaerae]RZS31214.1 uncharacterized protein (DUF2236 family) [Herbihabitans rhizosphaerae]
MARRNTPTPWEDYGFFGPDSVAWKVWGYPTAPVTGLQRAVVVEELDPPLIAAVDATGDNYNRPRTRYDRTIRYFAMVAFADSRTVSKAADVLVKVHSKAIGVEPLSGKTYDANDPHSQLWILLTGWHSVLKAYETYGPGKLSEEEENRYWEECAIAAELQTCDPADVPRTRDGVRAYFERMRPHLAASEAAQNMMHHLLNAQVILPSAHWSLRPALWAIAKVIRAGTIATMPHWMRRLGGLRQSRLTDVLVRPLLRLSYGVLHRVRTLKLAVLRAISPSTVPIVEPMWRGIAPANPVVLTPTEARERYGYDEPRRAHLALRARQRERVFGHGESPSDEGLVESQQVLGSLA